MEVMRLCLEILNYFSVETSKPGETKLGSTNKYNNEINSFRKVYLLVNSI